MGDTKIDMLDRSFGAQCQRINNLVNDGCITPQLGSLLLSYYALGRNEAAGETCDAQAFAESSFNPEHETTMLEFRTARPANLLLK